MTRSLACFLRAGTHFCFRNVTVLAVICIVLTGAQTVFATTQKAGGPGGSANIDLLQYFISQNPEDGEAWAKLADAYLNLKQNGEALKAVKEAVRLQPDSFRLRISFGALLDDAGDADGAILQYLAAIPLQPSNPYPHLLLGVVYQRRHELKSAEAAFRGAVRISPDFWSARKRLLLLLMERNEPETALAELREALRVDRHEFLASFVPNLLPIEKDEMQRATEEAVAHFDLGLLFALQKEVDQALKEFQQAVRVDSKFALGYQWLGEIYLEKMKLGEAVSAFQNALRVNTELSKAHLGLGAVYGQQGRQEDAIREMQEAIRTAPNHPEPYSALGYLYRELARPADALAAFQRALVLTDPKSQQAGPAHLNVALAYVNVGQLSPAWKHVHEAQQLGTSIPQEYLEFLSKNYPETKVAELEAETARLKKVLEDNPEDAETHMKLAEMLYRQGEFDSSVAEYRTVLRIAPAGQPLVIDAYRKLASAFEDMGRAKDAQETLEEALRANRTDPFLLNNAAWSYATTSDISLRNPQKALEYAKKAVELSGQKDAPNLDTLAEAYFVNGQFDAATEAIKKAIALVPDSAYYKQQRKKFEEAKRTKGGH